MKILLSSHFFQPSVGGIEEVSRVLAQEFCELGHETKVITETVAGDAAEFPYEVVRRPTPWRLLGLVGWCDVFFHNNISLRTAWPLLVTPRPWVVAHHTWMARVDGSIGWRDRLKQGVSRRAKNIAVSRALSSHISAPATIIGNPFRDALFQIDPNAVRDLDLVFLGRLVWDKGADLILRALGRLGEDALRPRLTIIGKGPEAANLERLCGELGLKPQVDFVGVKAGEELARLLNRHRLIVVPSRWQEPFGMVVLEGMACGCVPVVARCGGLPEAIGACGVTFTHGDAKDLAGILARLLAPDTSLAAFRAVAPAHLERHRARTVAIQYLRVMEEAVAR